MCLYYLKFLKMFIFLMCLVNTFLAQPLTWILWTGLLSDDVNKRSQRSKDFKDIDKALCSSIQERSSSCKFLSLKLVFIIIVCGTFITILHSPSAYETEHLFHSNSGYVQFSHYKTHFDHFLATTTSCTMCTKSGRKIKNDHEIVIVPTFQNK